MTAPIAARDQHLLAAVRVQQHQVRAGIDARRVEDLGPGGVGRVAVARLADVDDVVRHRSRERARHRRDDRRAGAQHRPEHQAQSLPRSRHAHPPAADGASAVPGAVPVRATKSRLDGTRDARAGGVGVALDAGSSHSRRSRWLPDRRRRWLLRASHPHPPGHHQQHGDAAREQEAYRSHQAPPAPRERKARPRPVRVPAATVADQWRSRRSIRLRRSAISPSTSRSRRSSTRPIRSRSSPASLRCSRISSRCSPISSRWLLADLSARCSPISSRCSRISARCSPISARARGSRCAARGCPVRGSPDRLRRGPRSA